RRRRSAPSETVSDALPQGRGTGGCPRALRLVDLQAPVADAVPGDRGAGLVDPAGRPGLRVDVLGERGDRLPGGGGHGEPEVGEDRVHRLVERRAAAGAVTGAAGGDALRLGAGEVGAAGVAGLGAHRGPGQSVDPALRVADARVVLLDGAAVPSRGRAGTAHG